MKTLTPEQFYALPDTEKAKYIFFSDSYQEGLDFGAHKNDGALECEVCCGGRDQKILYGTSDSRDPMFCPKCYEGLIACDTNPIFVLASDIEGKSITRKDIK